MSPISENLQQPGACVADSGGYCSDEHCADNCPLIKGTEGASVELDYCTHQNDQLHCEYIIHSPWCA